MFRRGLPFVVALVALATWLSPVGPGVPRAVAIPAANNDATYNLYGRVFPDPQGCTKGLPQSSPWAKGKVCAAQFLQWNETINGLKYLQQKFPRFAQLVNLHDLKKTVPEFSKLDMQSAGLPKTDLTRDRRDLYVFVVTDRDSRVPRDERMHHAYSLSIHGIERAGLEGGVRAAEDLITWAATAPNTRILEPSNSGPTAGDVLRNNVLYFVLSNPDGWQRGEVSKGGLYFQRYNGNGADVNREFPSVGYSNPVYTPFAEPEATGYAAYLLREKQQTKAKKFAGSLDLHGMGIADSFSFTLMSGTADDWQTNNVVVQQSQAIYSDAVKRLTWSSLIANPSECPGKVPVIVPVVGEGALPMCPDQWGTVWDTIDYQTTGAIGDWMTSDIGLGAIGVDNEMAFSHVIPDDVFVPTIEQLHIDGNKGIIYAQLATLMAPTQAPPVTVSAAYAPALNRKVRTAAASASPAALPAQSPITFATLPLLSGTEFQVNGPSQGVHNGGLSVEFTFANLQGLSLDGLNQIAIERFGSDHGEAPAWNEVGRWYRQELTYLPAGARIDINDPVPGRYRIKPGTGVSLAKVRISFTPEKVIPEPNVPYDVANTDVFRNLGPNIKPVTPAAILKDARALDGIATYVLADDAAPGVAPADRARWFDALKSFVTRGGTLVLTDAALFGLVDLGVVPAGAVKRGLEYGGWISFSDDANKPTFNTSPLTQKLDLAGAANGSGGSLPLRRQTFDPSALGYEISESTGISCESGMCFAPQQIVDSAAWAKAGGRVDGRGAAVLRPNSAETTGVGYGEVPVGRGRIRIAGALLPAPTEVNPHPYGLEGYGLAWTGWQVLVNLLSAGPVAVVQPATPTGVGGVHLIPRTGGDDAIGLDTAALAIALAALLRFARARRRLHPLS